MYIEEDTLDDVLRRVFTHLSDKGSVVRATRGKIKEACGVSIKLTNPLARLSASLDRGVLFSCLGELLWYLRGTASLKVIKHYIPIYKKESEDGYVINGAYGPRLFDFGGVNQFDRAIQTLRDKPTSRRAIISIISAADIARDRKEIPCTNTIQFLIRDNKLNCFVTMRSNDAYKGLLHDVFAFTMLQEIVARELGRELGYYHHTVASLHIYEDDIEKAKIYLEEGLQSTQFAMDKMPNETLIHWLPTILNAEQHYREKKKTRIKFDGLSEYWLDVCRLLKIYARTRGEAPDEDLNEASETTELLNTAIYREIALSRIDSVRERKKTTQLDLLK